MIPLELFCFLLMFGLCRSDTTSVHSPITGCHDGWTAYQGNCYLFADHLIRFVEAEHYCQQHGGHIVEVYASTENAFVKNELKRLGPTCAWIGMTDEMTEGSWKWYNNDVPMNYTDWYPGEDRHDNQDCGCFWKIHDYVWEDISCSVDCMSVCKQRGVVEIPDIIG